MKGEALLIQHIKLREAQLLGLLYLSLSSMSSIVEIRVYASSSTPALDFPLPAQVNEQSLREIGKRRKLRGDRHSVIMGTSVKGEAGEKGASNYQVLR